MNKTIFCSKDECAKHLVQFIRKWVFVTFAYIYYKDNGVDMLAARGVIGVENDEY